MDRKKRKKVLWYMGMALCIVIALWSVNYILFLAMESARTYANLAVIKERYYLLIGILAISIISGVICFVKARRVGTNG